MKIDKQMLQYPLTRLQSFFVQCWFNMVHQHSLDSHRVPVMNSCNILREAMQMTLPPASDDDRRIVFSEAHQILTSDPVLDQAKFAPLRDRILGLFDEKITLPKKSEAMFSHFGREILQLCDTHYLQTALSVLHSALLEDSLKDKPEPEQFQYVYRATASLLSHQIGTDASLEALFTLYSNVLIPRVKKEGYEFSKKLGLLRKIAGSEPREYTVTISIENVSKPSEFPNQMGGIQFSENPPALGKNLHPSVDNYCKPSKRRIFSIVKQVSRDPRTAGFLAYERVNEVMNLVRFEYEREKTLVNDSFACESRGKTGYRVFPISKVVPNPQTLVNSDALSAFVQSVNELVASEQFSEGRDRVNSAFRLYRYGLDADTFESKLTAWWTAIEYLVRGQSSVGNIGTAVEDKIVSVLGREYLKKNLNGYRVALLDVGVELVDPINDEPIKLRELTHRQFYELLKREDLGVNIVNALSQMPFFQHRILQFRQTLASTANLLTFIKRHETRVRWQIQRIYRARCDILHGAGRMASAALLCANLEYYLKVTLTLLLEELRSVSTLRTPKEFFERQDYAFESIKSELAKGSDTSLISYL